MSAAGRFLTLEGIEGVGKTTQVARLSKALVRARHRARGDARARGHAARGADSRARADRAHREPAGHGGVAAHVRRARGAPRQLHRAAARRRPLGDLRSFHGCDLRVSRSGPRPRRGQHRASGESGAGRAPSGSDRVAGRAGERGLAPRASAQCRRGGSRAPLMARTRRRAPPRPSAARPIASRANASSSSSACAPPIARARRRTRSASW